MALNKLYMRELQSFFFSSSEQMGPSFDQKVRHTSGYGVCVCKLTQGTTGSQIAQVMNRLRKLVIGPSRLSLSLSLSDDLLLFFTHKTYAL